MPIRFFIKNERKLASVHMGKVAALGCCVCHALAGCHHVRSGSGMGQKASDFETIPLCHNHHQGSRGIHTLGVRKWQGIFGMERDFLRETIFSIYGDAVPQYVVDAQRVPIRSTT